MSIGTSKAIVPRKGSVDREGNEVEDRIYNTKDFDHTLVLDDRTKLVANGRSRRILKESTDRFQKAIIFCVDQEHAARMRQALINENADLVDREPSLRHAHHRQPTCRWPGAAR